jgi:hypothetical protein
MSDQTEYRAAPEQVDHGFDEGVGQRPRPAVKRRVGGFADGIEPPDRSHAKRRRFSEGIEQFPDSPANSIEGRFSTGAEGSRRVA